MRDSVSIWATDMYYDWLPPLCWRTGRPADDRLAVTFRQRSYSAGLLILVGIVPFLIGRVLLGTTARGVLPMEHSALADLRTRLRAPYALLAMFAVLFAASFAGEWVPMLLASIAFLVGATVLSIWVNAHDMVRGRVVTADGLPDRVVVLRNVHPAFAEAVRRSYADRTARATSLPLRPSPYALNVGPPQEV